MQYTQIGTTKKSHGVHGELKVNIDEAYEDIFLEADRVFLELRGTMQPFFIESIRGQADLIVRFDDVQTPEAARLLQIRGIFLPTEELPQIVESNADGPEYSRLTGYRMVDARVGEIGTIRDVMEMPQQELAAVDYQGREILIPLNPQFIQSVDEGAKQVLVDLPEGLLAL
ncbi:MAG: ribosome maturation factor RimM [Saprospiraceae bacterium]|nr:16S rRNA processing protein RimM [Lewinellaceae bacterium]